MKKIISKYKYIHKSRVKGISPIVLNKGNWGLVSIEQGYITEKQLISIVTFLSKYLKNKNDIFINVSLNKPRTKKTIGSRMGGGKGNIDTYYSRIRSNFVLIEFLLKSENLAKYILRTIGSKLSFKTKLTQVVNKNYIY